MDDRDDFSADARRFLDVFPAPFWAALDDRFAHFAKAAGRSVPTGYARDTAEAMVTEYLSEADYGMQLGMYVFDLGDAHTGVRSMRGKFPRCHQITSFLRVALKAAEQMPAMRAQYAALVHEPIPDRLVLAAVTPSDDPVTLMFLLGFLWMVYIKAIGDCVSRDDMPRSFDARLDLIEEHVRDEFSRAAESHQDEMPDGARVAEALAHAREKLADPAEMAQAVEMVAQMIEHAQTFFAATQRPRAASVLH
jgi:hypothetical protein